MCKKYIGNQQIKRDFEKIKKEQYLGILLEEKITLGELCDIEYYYKGYSCICVICNSKEYSGMA